LQDNLQRDFCRLEPLLDKGRTDDKYIRY